MAAAAASSKKSSFELICGECKSSNVKDGKISDGRIICQECDEDLSGCRACDSKKGFSLKSNKCKICYWKPQLFHCALKKCQKLSRYGSLTDGLFRCYDCIPKTKEEVAALMTVPETVATRGPNAGKPGYDAWGDPIDS